MTLDENGSRAIHAVISDSALSVAEITAATKSPGFGAVLSFVGVVRDHDHDRRVVGLDYVAHPSAPEILVAMVGELAEAHPDCALAVAHRTGSLSIGDMAFVVVSASPHRRQAFTALYDVVETVKAQLPIWKCQHFADGTTEWVNCA